MSLKVIDPGFWTTVQDSGRVGYREWGVPRGGAFDRGSAGLANALAGNDQDAAVLELTLRGGVYEAVTDLAIALAGAPLDAELHRPAMNRPRPLFVPCGATLRAGDRLVLGRMAHGARTYLAVRHGLETALRMGSRATEETLKKGDVLPVGRSASPARYLNEPVWLDPSAHPLRIIAGPDSELLEASECLTSNAFRIGSQSDRMGLRLEGPAVELPADPDRLSAPVAPGALQVAGGRLIVLGVACGTMGGYPHVAHVISADLDRLGQLRPGDLIRFEHVPLSLARDLDQARRQAQRSLINRVTSLARDIHI